MIRSTALRTDPSSGDSVLEHLKVYLKTKHTFNRFADLCCNSFKFFRLNQCTRIAIQEISLLAVRLLKPVFHHRIDDFIRHQLASIHICFGLVAKICMIGNIGSQHITCRNMRNIIFLQDQIRHRTLACSGRSHNQNVHFLLPFNSGSHDMTSVSIDP